MTTNNILLNQLIGKRIKVFLIGRTLTGILDKFYYGEDSRGKFYQWVITTRNGFRFSFASIDVKGYEVL